MNQIRRKIEGLFKEFVGIREAAEAENRALTEKDKAARAKLQEEIQQLVRSIDPGANPPSGENALRGFLYGDEPGSGARTMETGNLGSNNMHSRNAASYELRGPNDKKDYRSLFGDNAGATWTDKNIDFFRAVKSGKITPEDLNSLREALFFDIMGCLVRMQDRCKAHGLEPEEVCLSFDHPNESRGKHYASVSLRIG
ncbi:MAG: hypothetical protein WAO51_07975 [Bacillota bacterium]